ncbi:putative membrane protease (lipoprotein) [Vibrio diabolicus]|nr:putative membrane protease (lipoprotein) [Vibrio diabolicus]
MFLFKRNDSKISYSFKASILSACIVFVLACLYHFFVGFPEEAPNENLSFSFFDAFGLILLAPVVETTLLVLLILLAQKVTENTLLVACMVALFISVLHSLSHPLWGLFTFVPFVVFCLGFQVWQRVSTSEGAKVAFLTHAFHNSYVLILVGLSG